MFGSMMTITRSCMITIGLETSTFTSMMGTQRSSGSVFRGETAMFRLKTRTWTSKIHTSWSMMIIHAASIAIMRSDMSSNALLVPISGRVYPSRGARFVGRGKNPGTGPHS